MQLPMLASAEQARALVRAARYRQNQGGGGIRGMARAGQAAGILTTDETLPKHCLTSRTLFVAVGLVATCLRAKAAHWQPASTSCPVGFSARNLLTFPNTAARTGRAVLLHGTISF